jgi:hypothetical protein
MTAPLKTGLSPSNPQALYLGLSGMLSAKQFPRRTTLMVSEVGRAIGMTDQQVISLINEGVLGAVEITGCGNISSRKHWRIPVQCYDDYIRRRSNSKEFSDWIDDIFVAMRREQLTKLIARTTEELRRRPAA